MSKIYLYSDEPIEVESLEEVTLPNTSFKMLKIKGTFERQNYTEQYNPETGQYDLKPNPVKEEVEVIVPFSRVIKYEP